MRGMCGGCQNKLGGSIELTLFSHLFCLENCVPKDGTKKGNAVEPMVLVLVMVLVSLHQGPNPGGLLSWHVQIEVGVVVLDISQENASPESQASLRREEHVHPKIDGDRQHQNHWKRSEETSRIFGRLVMDSVQQKVDYVEHTVPTRCCLLYTSPSPRDRG